MELPIVPVDPSQHGINVQCVYILLLDWHDYVVYPFMQTVDRGLENIASELFPSALVCISSLRSIIL